MRTLIQKVLQREEPLDEVQVAGWIRTRRDSKTFSFLELNDGSCLQNIQIIADADLASYGDVEKLSTGAFGIKLNFRISAFLSLCVSES